jgi:hypothetical protein
MPNPDLPPPPVDLDRGLPTGAQTRRDVAELVTFVTRYMGGSSARQVAAPIDRFIQAFDANPLGAGRGPGLVELSRILPIEEIEARVGRYLERIYRPAPGATLDDDAEHIWVGLAPCGCAVAWSADRPDQLSAAAKRTIAESMAPDPHWWLRIRRSTNLDQLRYDRNHEVIEGESPALTISTVRSFGPCRRTSSIPGTLWAPSHESERT